MAVSAVVPVFQLSAICQWSKLTITAAIDIQPDVDT